MNTRFRRITGFLKRSLIYMTVFVLILAAAGMVYQTAATEADRRNFPPPGNLIDVGGFKMHIHCEGEGNPTVILEAMSGGVSTQWGWIEPEVRKETRVCVYDRAGFGWSEPDPEAPTLGRTVRNLHTLLVNANIQGPYVMVGHSLGGVYVRRFAQEYPDEVAGVVLVDEANPKQFVKYPELFGDRFVRMLKAAQFAMRLGVGHLFFALGGETDFSGLAEPQESQFKAIWSSPQYFDAQIAEIQAGRGIWTEALHLNGLGDKPLVVLSRGTDLGYEWKDYQADLVTLSTDSRQITVEGASHTALMFDQKYAGVVSAAILQMLDAVRAGTRLAAQL